MSTVAEIMKDDPTTVGPKEPVIQVVQRMVDEHIGAVLVVENDQCLGIFTERDVLRMFPTATVADFAAPVSDFMTKDPDCAAPGDSFQTACDQLRLGGYRHIPVLDDGKPVGILSIKDIVIHSDFMPDWEEEDVAQAA